MKAKLLSVTHNVQCYYQKPQTGELSLIGEEGNKREVHCLHRLMKAPLSTLEYKRVYRLALIVVFKCLFRAGVIFPFFPLNELS